MSDYVGQVWEDTSDKAIYMVLEFVPNRKNWNLLVLDNGTRNIASGIVLTAYDDWFYIAYVKRIA